MLEARDVRDVRMGQYSHSNQPSHHILYMYDVAGQPWKTQDKVRDALSRLYVGSEIGQGYPGDEDNGEMSAWYVFSAAGFYPLRMGSPEYVIGAPYFPHMDIHLGNGKHIVINASAVSDTNRYIQSLQINGQPWNALSLPHALLSKGATLDFVMGPKPSAWGSDASSPPASLTAEGQMPLPMRDLTGAGQGEASSQPAMEKLDALFDSDSDTEATLPAGASTVSWHFPQAREVVMFTLTSGATSAAPSDWQLEASSDGEHWHRLDTRKNETFSSPTCFRHSTAWPLRVLSAQLSVDLWRGQSPGRNRVDRFDQHEGSVSDRNGALPHPARDAHALARRRQHLVLELRRQKQHESASARIDIAVRGIG